MTMTTEKKQPKEAVAIIGMACRFPGGAHNPEQFFENLEAGKSAWSEFPSDRLNIDGFYHPSPQRHDSFTFRGAHFLTGNIAAFDSEFFSMSATESNSTDVQQRILLEVAYEAVENAGIPKETLAGSNASVYIGSFVKDYEQVSMRDAQYLAADCATGNGIAIMSNRISYFFDIHGPSMTIDTGCSASLICIHQAVQSLLNGESSVAMAGGAGMILTPSTIMPMVSLGFLSKDGKCYTFDSRANGYGRGEGVGIIVLKRLSDAIRDNDTIRGVIRGTSTNQDGRTSGITMPSSEAQVVNIRKCYSSAGLDVNKTMFVECHGTGTQAGDPRELKAISDALCNNRTAEDPMLVGSIKTNIGHLEGSAGVAGVIKAVMTIEKGRIPRHINFESWNPDIDHRGLKVDIPLENTAWPVASLRRISVNSFGFGGSNAHAIIDDAAHYLQDELQVAANHNTNVNTADDTATDVDERQSHVPYLYVFSANDRSGVARTVAAHQQYLSDKKFCGPSMMRDYAYTLLSRRSKLQYQTFAVASSHQALMGVMSKIKELQPIRSWKSKDANLAFVFCGQGAQSPRMGMDLCVFEPFRRSLEDSGALLRTVDDCFDLLGVLADPAYGTDPPRINNPAYAQPAMTALQVALVDLLTACGVKPTAVVGHSSGEIAAAYAAGMITKRAAMTIAYFRGEVASKVQRKGSMLAVSLSSADSQKYVNSIGKGAVCIACINSPESVTLSGDTEQIRHVQEVLNNDGVANKLLLVETAYHSHHMRAVSKQYQLMLDACLSKPTAKPNGAAMFSSVLGERVTDADLGSIYWVENMVSPVEFEKAVSAMMKAEKGARPDIFLEVSPNSVLRKPLSETVRSSVTSETKGRVPYFSVMLREKNAAHTALKALGELWARGVPLQLDWLHHAQQRSDGKPKCLVDLPTYPWNHSQTYWHESHLSKAHRFRKFGSLDFLGAMTADSITPHEPRWRGFIDITENPWIEHHKIQNKIMYPAAGMVVMAIEAAKQMVDGVVDHPSDIFDFEISKFKIEEPMVVPENETRLEYNFNATRVEDKTEKLITSWKYSFAIYSLQDTSAAPPYQHTVNARGFFAVRFRPRGWSGLSFRDVVVKAAMSEVKTKDHPDGVNFAGGMNPREFYERLNIIGLNYGRLFRNITRLSAARDYKNVDSAKHCWFQVRIPNTRAAMPEEYEQSATIHPATLDAVFQTLFVFGDDPMVPHFIQSIRVAAAMPQGAGHEFLGSAVAVRKGKREAQADISMWEDLEGKQPILDIVGLKVITIATPRTATPDFLPDHRNLCSQVVWGKDVHCVNPSSHTFKTILELMGHNFPGLRALQVGGDADVARFVFTVLGSDTTPRLSSYTIMNETDGIFNKAQTAIANELRPLLGYHQLAHKHNLADSLKQQKYDLILADSRMGIDRGVLTQFLKPTGILARTHHGPDTYCVAAHDPFTGFFLPMTDQPAWMPGPWYSLPQAYPARMSAENVIILVQHIHASPIIKPLVEQLKHMAVGLAVQVMTMTDFWNAILGNETLENIDSYIICLYELTQHPLVYNANRWSYHFVQKLFQKSNQGLLWVTNGAQMETRSPLMAPFLGWARTVRSEEPDKHIICLDVAEEEAHESLGPARTALEICLLFFRSFTSMVPAAVRDVEFTLENGWLHVPRLEPLKEINNLIEKGLDQAQITRKLRGKKPLKLDGGPTGSHEDMHYREDESVERELGPEEVLIEVEECPLLPCDTAVFPSNVREAVYVTDVLGKVLAVGEGVHKFGVLSGEDIVAITLGPVRTHVIVHQSRVWRVYNPEKLKHSLACLITASYCLRDDPSDPIKTVLVYGPAGAQGQAAISLCEHRHIEVFAAVSNQTQRELLTEAGILADDHIVDHDKQLSLNVLQATGGRRVDAIFNAMTDPQKVVTSLSLLRPYGHIIHVVPPHTSPDSYEALPTGGFKLTVFDIGLWLDHYPGVEPVLAEQFDAVNFNSQRQELRSPAGMRVHSFGSITSTVRKMDDDPHYGVHILSGIPSETLPIGRLPRETFPEARLSGSGMYLVAGGLGGLGLDVVMWLADHGARYLTILSRTDVSSHGRLAGACLEALRNQGVEVSVQRVDICDEGLCRSVIRDINSRRPIKGVIHAAAVIKDGIYQNLTYEDWTAVTDVKMAGSWNLHNACSGEPRNDPVEGKVEPDFFVLLSSAAGIIGNLGQANYNAGNSFQDALARHRSAKGMHTVSIDLGPVIGAGMVAENEGLWDQLRAGGFIGVRLEDFHAVLEWAIASATPFPSAAHPPAAQKAPRGLVCPPQVVMGVGTGGLVKQEKTTNPFWTRTALFSYLNRVDLRPGEAVDDEGAGGGGPTATLKPALKAASTRAEAATLLLPYFVRALGEVMGKNHTEIDPDSVLDDHGPDSLRMKEILDWVSSATGVKISGINQMPIRSICAQIADLGGFGGED